MGRKEERKYQIGKCGWAVGSEKQGIKTLGKEVRKHGNKEMGRRKEEENED